MADFEEILGANSELLLDRITKLRTTEAGSEAEKEMLDSYYMIFKNHMAILKLNEETLKNDNDEEIAKMRFEVDKDKIEIDSRRIDLDRELNAVKLESEERSEKSRFIKEIAIGVLAASTPIICEGIKQAFHLGVCNKVLKFEETGTITSTVGKAEFRK